MDKQLKTEWDAERCPILDGIIFGDGRVRRMSVQWVRNTVGRMQLSVRTAEWTSVAELAAKEELQWTSVIPLCTNNIRARNLSLVCGEGGLGSDGFVAVLRPDRAEIVWIAFFTNSNPFEMVELADDQVMARTNLGTWWSFPLHSPEAVTLR